MKKNLILALLGVFVLASGCGGSSGVAVGTTDEQAAAGSENDADAAAGTNAEATGGIDSTITAGTDGDAHVDVEATAGGEAPGGADSDATAGTTETDNEAADEPIVTDVRNPARVSTDSEVPDTADSGTLIDDPVITDSLLPPVNLSSFRYSSTAGELFWEGSSQAGSSTRYRIERDGVVLDTVAQRSYYTNTLSAATAHEMSVYVVDGLGKRSDAATVTFNAQNDVPPPRYEFELGLDRSRATLKEGSNAGARFVIDITPEGEEPVDLKIQGLSSDSHDGLTISLGKSVLSSDDSQTSVSFQLSVGMQPILPQELKFKVVGTSGDEVRSAEIFLDVEPTSAPDVYLLIGQSNMVGSSEAGAKEVTPGGLDQRHSRIYQLNVVQNNYGFFENLGDFLDESNNAINPRFIEAEDPLHDPRNPVAQFKGGTTVGPGLSFAKAALADTTQRIYLVPAAWGATGFCDGTSELFAWNAAASSNPSLGGSGLLERALIRLKMTLRDSGGILRGILWHQGGADSGLQACADTYAENLRLMVERLRREALPDARGSEARGSQAPIPFIVATQSKGSDERGNYSRWSRAKTTVDSVHRNISAVVPYADWVNNDDLVPPAYPCGSSSCVHFGATANRETGRRFYDALKRIWNR